MYHKILLGDVLDGLKTLPDMSVHCVVTSPPYYGLRDYGNEKQIGLEDTPEEYISKMVDVFREVWRVLRDDGTVWLNIGDSYNGSGKGRNADGLSYLEGGKQATSLGTIKGKLNKTSCSTLKPKDLIGIPWMLAFALRAEGWYLRQDIIYSKKNCMPESVADRCTKSHEYVFLLTKKPTYFYDAYAIKEPAAYDGRKDESFKGAIKYDNGGVMPEGQPQTFYQKGSLRWQKDENENRVRNKRSVWHISSQPSSENHFAMFPDALITPCIKAGTSEYGCCSVCGAPYVRKLESVHVGDGNPNHYDERKMKGNQLSDDRKGTKYYENAFYPKTLGWYPTCSCNADIIPCVVLDIFGGSGTTMVVSRMLNRSSIMIELNAKYIQAIKNKLRLNEQLDVGICQYEIKSV